MLEPLTPPGTASAPTNTAPSAQQLAQGQQQASGMYSLDPNYRPQREERGPVQVRQNGWLGNGQVRESRASGGDPLFAATLAVPTFEIDRSLQNIRQQKADIEKWMAGATEQFKGRAADPYQKAYQDYVTQEHNRFFDDVAKTYYGGDRSKAVEATRRDPELNRQFMNMNRSLGAIGDANKTGYDYYEKVDDAVRKGETEVDAETRQLLQQGLNGEWAFNGMGPAHNAAQFDRLNDRLSMNKLFNDFYEKNVNNAGDVTADQWGVTTKNGRKFLVIPSEKSYDEFVDSFVDQAMKDAPYRDKDEVRKFVEARVPRESTVKVDELARGVTTKIGSGGRASATPENRVWTSSVQTNMANTDTGGRLVETVNKDGVKRRTPAVQSISVGNVVDGRQEQFSKPVQFRDGNTPVKMIWTGIDRGADGSIMLVGYDPSSTDTQTNVDDIKIEIDDLNSKIREDEKRGKFSDETDKQFNARVEQNKKRRSELLSKAKTEKKAVRKRMVPLKGNEGVADGLLGGRLQQELSKFGTAPTGGASNSTADPLGIL